jgi:putative ABC transport system permease protein
LRRTVYGVNPRQPVEKIAALGDALSDTVIPQRFFLYLFTGFSTLAIVVAAIGLHGLLQYQLASRRHEMGVRIATGAAPADLVRLLVGLGLRIVAVGVVAGVVGSFGSARLLTVFLQNVNPRDPVALTTATAALCIVSLATCLAALRSLLAIDPVECLRRG